jgi:hypothetical protein
MEAEEPEGELDFQCTVLVLGEQLYLPCERFGLHSQAAFLCF